MNLVIVGFLALLAVAACTRTSATRLSANQVVISTSAAPACSSSSTKRVASKMAAVETLRNGYSRYVIVGTQSSDNVKAISTGPTHANTTGQYNVVGNTVVGNSTTTYGGARVIFTGSRDADLHVLMLNPGDAWYSDGIDAKAELGENWRELVEKGIRTCVE